MRACIRELIDLLKTGKRMALSRSKYESAFLGCIRGAEGSEFLVAAAQLTTLLQLLRADDRNYYDNANHTSSVPEGFSRWATGSVIVPEMPIQVASNAMKGGYGKSEVLLQVVLSRIGLWPTLATLGTSPLHSGKSVLGHIGLDFVLEFSTGMLSFLQHIITFKAGVSEGNDCYFPALDGTSTKLIETFDLFYCLCRNKGLESGLSSPGDINFGGVCRQYFTNYWKSELSNLTDAGETATDYCYCWSILGSGLQAVLTEYDPVECGWRVGKLGRAEHADARMTSVVNALRSSLTSLYVSCAEVRDHFGGDSLKFFKDRPLNGSSMSQSVAKSTLQVLSCTFSNMSVIFNGTVAKGNAMLGGVDNSWNTIWKHVKHIVALLSLMACEQYLGLVSLSGSAFIEALTARLNAGTFITSECRWCLICILLQQTRNCR